MAWTEQNVSPTGELLRLIADGTPRTRAELLVETGQARTAVTARIEDFLLRGLVTSPDHAPSTGGRPPSRLAFNPRIRSLIAIDMGASHSTIAVTDLDGEVLAERRELLDITLGPVPVLDHALDVCLELLREAGVPPEHVAGIGIGVPGPVEHSTGRPVSPPIMPGWHDFDIPAYVRDRIDTIVLVDNDVNLLALGEWSTRFSHVDDLLFAKISTGIGAGVISGGRLQRGAVGAAGDLGHVQVPRTSATDHREGDLEALASGSALARLLDSPDRRVTTTADVLALLADGDRAAVAESRTAGRCIGEVIATCVSLLNPSVVVVGGSLALAGTEFIAGIREVVYRRSLPLATQRITIVIGDKRDNGGIRGAALMLREYLLSPEKIDSFIEGIPASCGPVIDIDIP